MTRSLRAAGILLAIALLAGTALLLGAILYQRQAALRNAHALTVALSAVIAEQAGATMQAADHALRLIAGRLQYLRIAGRLDEETARAALQAELKQLGFLRAVWVLDAQGRVAYASDPVDGGMDLADRPYFQAYVQDPRTEFRIGGPLRSRRSGRWMLNVSRPLRDAAGAIEYVVVAAVEPAYFERLWQGLQLEADTAVALYHRSGQILARTPVQEQLRGRDYSSLPLFREHLPRAAQGSFEGVSGIDGVPRILAYREVAPYPELVVVVGSSRPEALEAWRRFAVVTGAAWTVAVAVAMLLMLQVRRQAHRRELAEMRFRPLAQAMPHIVFVADERGSVSFINRRWAEVTGVPVEEAYGRRWQELVHPEERADMAARLAETVRKGEELQLEHRLRYRDGSYHWQLMRAVPVHEPGEARPTWVGTSTDIDAQKRAQELLHEQAEQLDLAGRLVRMGYWRFDLATQRVRFSPTAAAILDLPPDVEPSAAEVLAMMVPEMRATGEAALQQGVAAGDAFDVEVEMVTPVGRHVWIRSIGEPVRDAQGRVVAIQGAQQDITLRVLIMDEIQRLNASLEERIAQRTGELARQEALFRALAENAPLPIWTVDRQGAVTFLSRAWYELTGCTPPEGLGHDWFRLVHPDDLAAVKQNWLRSAESGEVYTGTRRLRGHDGAYHFMTYRAVPARDDKGEILFWVGVDSDITDIMANQAALRLANRQLEAFSYSVSHDLQSPLQRIGSYARLLEQELAGLPQGRAHHFLSRIRANADTMSDLIRGLLALAQVSEMELIRTTVNLSELAVEILQQLEAEHPERRVQWRVDPDLAVMGDARLLRSVLENLLGNAWKFTSRAEHARIDVGGWPERGEYFVRDNGCGFDMAYADRLFDTFQRLHDADEYPGTGIGLATVARAISRHGGRVWAQSAPGEGATFFFTLPTA